MGWTKTDHEGQVMWERGGERVKEVPEERPERDVDYVVVYRYRKGINPWWLLLVYLFGCLVGSIPHWV